MKVFDESPFTSSFLPLHTHLIIIIVKRKAKDVPKTMTHVLIERHHHKFSKVRRVNETHHRIIIAWAHIIKLNVDDALIRRSYPELHEASCIDDGACASYVFLLS